MLRTSRDLRQQGRTSGLDDLLCRRQLACQSSSSLCVSRGLNSSAIAPTTTTAAAPT